MDDTPEALQLVTRLLGREYTVLVASDPLGGIELAREHRPDLVLLDINMPNLSGREVATRLRALLPDTPLVAFSADVTAGARERALAAGCVGYITKPLDVDTFGDQVAAFLGGKRDAAPALKEYVAYQAEVVEHLEQKVRALTEANAHNARLNEQNSQLLRALQRRQQLLEAGARVARSITSILDLDGLLRAAVDIICEEYRLYYAAIFLLDEGEQWAVLRAGYGEAGAAMLAQGHRLTVGGESMIGTAIQTHTAQIAHDVEADGRHHFKNPLLPHTRSEIALPLLFKDKVLGAITVQSRQVDAFDAADITALQMLADQVAIAIHNALLLRDLEAANRELLRNKTLQAIATATGETIHWVGNKAAPIPPSVAGIRKELGYLLAGAQVLLALPHAQRAEHPLWPVMQAALEAATGEELSLETQQAELAAMSPKQLRRLGGVASILEDLNIILQSANTILSIKENLIGPARLQTPALLMINELVRDTVAGMALPDGVVATDLAAGLPPIRADARQLGQVFNNLVKNAWEALYRTAEPRIRVATRLSADGRQVLVDVQDNGPGIPPEILEKIWMSFFTTKGDRGGTGLGLSACMQIVSQAEGQITVDSQVGAGTTFTVSLPAANAA
jgi:signal transduction histidine kinase/DNA-binding NarL/FixJ family response regulator